MFVIILGRIDRFEPAKLHFPIPSYRGPLPPSHHPRSMRRELSRGGGSWRALGRAAYYPGSRRGCLSRSLRGRSLEGGHRRCSVVRIPGNVLILGAHHGRAPHVLVRGKRRGLSRADVKRGVGGWDGLALARGAVAALSETAL